MPDIRRLIFIERSEEHIARHGVTPDEVREVCQSRPLIGPGRQGKTAVLGQSLSGRYLMVVLAARTTGALVRRHSSGDEITRAKKIQSLETEMNL
jgi:hypothetical protein